MTVRRTIRLDVRKAGQRVAGKHAVRDMLCAAPTVGAPLTRGFAPRRYRNRAENGTVYSLGHPSIGSPIGIFVARSLIDLVTLDLQIEEEISRYGTPRDFHIVLWRHDPDTTGCNWNAHIERIRGNLTDSSWWDVVPQMRERFNLR